MKTFDKFKNDVQLYEEQDPEEALSSGIDEDGGAGGAGGSASGGVGAATGGECTCGNAGAPANNTCAIHGTLGYGVGEYRKKKKPMGEDEGAPTNNVGSGNIAGYSPFLFGNPVRRKPVDLTPIGYDVNETEKHPSEMTPGEINKRLDRHDKLGSALNHEMIAAGRGNERPSEYLHSSKTDPLSKKLQDHYKLHTALHNEIERRYGPGAPSRLPIKGPKSIKSKLKEDEKKEPEVEKKPDTHESILKDQGFIHQKGPYPFLQYCRAVVKTAEGKKDDTRQNFNKGYDNKF